MHYFGCNFIIYFLDRIQKNKVFQLHEELMKEFQIHHDQEGDTAQKPQSTLLEPVSETLKRDLQNIILKLKYAIIPTERQDKKQKHAKQLRKWDLWGPFVLCLLLSATLAFRTSASQQTIITSIFVIMWIGSIVVWLNAYFLGSNMSFFQSASLLGYCVFPLNIVSFLTCIIGGWIPPFIKLILVVLSLIWSSKSAIGFIGEMVPQKKKKLALYPVTLFYLFLSWFVLII